MALRIFDAYILTSLNLNKDYALNLIIYDSYINVETTMVVSRNKAKLINSEKYKNIDYTRESKSIINNLNKDAQNSLKVIKENKN